MKEFYFEKFCKMAIKRCYSRDEKAYLQKQEASDINSWEHCDEASFE